MPGLRVAEPMFMQVNVGMTEREHEALQRLAASQKMSRQAVLRAALRSYQLIREVPAIGEAFERATTAHLPPKVPVQGGLE
jgi:hypothetical protein